MARSGRVFIQNEYAGVIRETDDGYEFFYEKSYLEKNGSVAASLTLPLREQPYTSRYLFPFFDGMIPEGWLLGVVERNWKLDKNDRFGLMLASCRDCIGDVRIET
ncbi:MAG: HipA N-terminal domain-containing protein [Butyrivibrio sp.]|nr:HipA N-terminal domain-containing protein [Butyrivibrio sp.]